MQVRAKTGYSFERKVRKREGFERYIKAPRIKWTGVGRNNVQKLLSLNKNPRLFKPIMEESKFTKSRTLEVKMVLYMRLKKYSKKDIIKFKLYFRTYYKGCPHPEVNGEKGIRIMIHLKILMNITSSYIN